MVEQLVENMKKDLRDAGMEEDDTGGMGKWRQEIRCGEPS